MQHTQIQVNKQEQTRPQRAKRGFIPAWGLFFLSPLVGEFLLGNLSITMLWVLISLAPLYGGGALLIRETTRRLGLGWPSMVVFGLVYAIIEEAYVTQSLFNPDYVGLRLLDYGYISSLGIGAWWTVFVLSIHTIWSTAVPIAIVESLTPDARRTPWLGPLGLAITAVVFVLGCVLMFFFQQQEYPYMASTTQLIVSGVIIVILIVIAIALGRVQVEPSTEAPPSFLMAGGVPFVLASAYMALVNVPESIPAILTVVGLLGLLAVGSWFIWNWSRRTGWSARHELAVAGGLLLVYVWYGFVQVPSAGDTSPLVDAVGNAIFGIGALILLLFAWRRVSASKPNQTTA